MPEPSIPGTNASTHSTAHYFLAGLSEAGVEYLFCNLGTDHAPIVEEMARWSRNGLKAPKVILCAHENLAIHMAGGYALMTGRGQGVLVHVDAGTANIVNGMHNLYRNRLPVFVMAGSAPFTSFGELTGSRDTYVTFVQQPYDQASLVRPYVKWEYALPSGVVAKETVARACALMESEPKGPVYLTIPREILTQQWDESGIRSFPASRFGPQASGGTDPELVRELAGRLITARNPILITAYGGRDPSTSRAIERLARVAGIRVIDFLSINNISHEFDIFGGYQPDKLDAVDVGLMVDVDVPWMPVVTNDNPATWWAQIDVDVLKGGSPIWSFPANLRLQGASSRILDQLLAAVEDLSTPEFLETAEIRATLLVEQKRARDAQAEQLAANKGVPGAINEHYLARELGRALGPDDVIVNEAVTRQPIFVQQIPRPNPGTMISNGGGGLGMSGGFALGVKLARPDVVVVQVVGDGSLYFNNPSAVLAASREYDLPILTIVLDNSGWAAVKNATLRVYPGGEASQTGLFHSNLPAGMEFSKLAEVSGSYGERLTDPVEVPAAIARCLTEVKGGRSALLHVSLAKH